MLISRQLRVALAVSFLWHLFWLSFVSVKFAPSALRKQQFAKVNFLGSILAESLPLVQGSKVGARLITIPDEAYLNSRAVLAKRSFVGLSSEKRYLEPDELIDIDQNKKIPVIFEGVSPSALDEIRTPEVLFRPDFPQYLEWDQQQIKNNSALFKIYISIDGLVQQVINLRTCGNPEVDVALARYLRRWRFAPSLGIRGQWQKIELDLESGSAYRQTKRIR